MPPLRRQVQGTELAGPCLGDGVMPLSCRSLFPMEEHGDKWHRWQWGGRAGGWERLHLSQLSRYSQT